MEKWSAIALIFFLVCLFSYFSFITYSSGQNQIELQKQKTEQMKIELERDKLGLTKEK